MAFWYQKGKAKRYAAVPPGAERIVRGSYIEAESLAASVKSGPEDAPKPAPQAIGPVASGGSQLFFTPPEGGAWMELPFEVPEDGRYALKVDLTRSWDYGIWQVFLDGKRAGGPRNLRSPEIAVKAEKLGNQELSKGRHVLRFECVGRDPQAVIRDTGKPGQYLGIDGISYRKLAIPRG